MPPARAGSITKSKMKEVVCKTVCASTQKRKYEGELKDDDAHDTFVNSEDGPCKNFAKLTEENNGKAPKRGEVTKVGVSNSQKTRYEVLKGRLLDEGVMEPAP